MSSSVAICPNCARASERPILCDRCGWRWYANPRPAAGALVERILPGAGEPSVLVLRRAVEPGIGDWDLPAGYLEVGESPEEAAVRETTEEAGFEVVLVRLAGVYTSRPGNAVCTVFLARSVDPEAPVRTDPESDDHAWVARSAVAEWLPRMAFESMAGALRDWGDERYGEPQW